MTRNKACLFSIDAFLTNAFHSQMVNLKIQNPHMEDGRLYCLLQKNKTKQEKKFWFYVKHSFAIPLWKLWSTQRTLAQDMILLTSSWPSLLLQL
jgi:hypothetical protein